MSDIVERLRKYKSWDNPVSAEEAAAEIERLNTSIYTMAVDAEQLRAALAEIKALDNQTISEAGKAMRAVAIARRVLEGMCGV
jgi:hypothetical protein